MKRIYASFVLYVLNNVIMPLRIFFTMNNCMHGRWNDGNNASIMQSLCTFDTVVGCIGETCCVSRIGANFLQKTV
jgi:hypothetical protein